MKEDNKENLKRILALFAAALIALSAGITLITISDKLWPVALPSSGGAIYAAVILFRRSKGKKIKYEDPEDKEEKHEG